MMERSDKLYLEPKEIEIRAYTFKVREYTISCVLLSDQVEVMTEFFNDLNTELWEVAKEKALNKLFLQEYPNLKGKNIPKHLIENCRSFFTFRDLEKGDGIKNLIKSIQRENTIKKILE